MFVALRPGDIWEAVQGVGEPVTENRLGSLAGGAMQLAAMALRMGASTCSLPVSTGSSIRWKSRRQIGSGAGGTPSVSYHEDIKGLAAGPSRRRWTTPCRHGARGG